MLSRSISCVAAATVLLASWASDGVAADRPARFTDVTGTSGLFVGEHTGVGGTNPHAVAVEDFNGDGRFDVVIATFGQPHVLYVRNQGDLRFTDVTRGSGLETFAGEGTGAAVADFDRDGRLDLFLASLRGGASRLYCGRPEGAFEDVSQSSKVLLHTPARSCAWSDVDGDGWADLFVTCPDGPNRLFLNQRDGTFRDAAAEAGVALADRHSLGCAFGDVDDDGRDDLFVTNYRSQSSALFRNLGQGRFQDVTSLSGTGRRASAVGCVLADVFNRGRLDLYVTTDSWLSGANYTEPELLQQGHTVEPNLLYRNRGLGSFVPIDGPPSRHKALSHDTIVEDLDHDGRSDIYVGVDAIPTGNRFATSKGGNPLWKQQADGTWENLARAWGVDFEGNCVSVPAADFDDDGDLDLLLVNFYENMVLYRNNTNDRNWLRVRVAGKRSNPDGLGARISLFSEPGGELLGTRHIQSGSGYCRSSPLEAHFGLGASPASSFRLEVVWPATQKRSVHAGVRRGQKLHLREPD